MVIFSPNHGALLPKPRSCFSPNHGAASPQTTGLLLPKPRSTSLQTTEHFSPNHGAASPHTLPDPTRAAPRLQEHHCGAVWSTATHSLCREHVWRMAWWISCSDGTCREPGGPTRGV